ncbi:MAG TPA: hypothetical protein VM680_18670 [Verrucomicrobiae bacterium]|nr:hypothetical protein [Verrucomicrobiae bacterium]
MSLWTIKIGDEQKSLADWGFKTVRRQLQNQSLDTLTFRQPTAAMNDDAPLVAGDIVELYRGDVRWFYGRAEAPRSVGDVRSGGFEYRIASPWWYLEHMGFRQKFKFRTSIQDEALQERYSSYCILGTKIDGTKQSIRDQIREAVNYAIEQGAPILLEAGDQLPTVIPPSMDAWNSPVAEVIRSMCATVPDISVFFDYSTEPYPTLRFRRRGQMTAVNLDIQDERLIPSGLELQPREDLQVPGVVIYYLNSAVVNGLSYSQVTEDVFPEGTTGREPKALVAAINLEASSISYAQATIQCIPIAAGNKDWWIARMPQLAQASVTGLVVTSPEAVALPNELVGQYANWMGGMVANIVVRAMASYTEVEVDDNGAVRLDRDQKMIPVRTVQRPISFEVLATNLASGTYNSLPSGTLGEAQPAGMAEALYNATRVLQYEGTIPIQEDQCSGRVGLGNLVNLTGGRAEWADMNAQPYSIIEDIDNGRTQVMVGPPKNLGPADYMELLRATRNRFRFAPPAARATGIGGVGSTVSLGDKIQRSVPGMNYGAVTRQVWKNPTDPTAGSIDFNVADTAGKAIAVREQQVCIDGDDNWYIRLPCSEPYRR